MFSEHGSFQDHRLYFVCNEPGQLAASCYQKDNSFFVICKATGPLASACKHQQIVLKSKMNFFKRKLSQQKRLGHFNFEICYKQKRGLSE